MVVHDSYLNQRKDLLEHVEVCESLPNVQRIEGFDVLRCPCVSVPYPQLDALVGIPLAATGK